MLLNPIQANKERKFLINICPSDERVLAQNNFVLHNIRLNVATACEDDFSNTDGLSKFMTYDKENQCECEAETTRNYR